MVVVFHRIAVWQTYSCVESMHAEWGQHHEDMQDRSPVKGEASVKGLTERKVGHTKKSMKNQTSGVTRSCPNKPDKTGRQACDHFCSHIHMRKHRQLQGCPVMFYVVHMDMSILLRGTVHADYMH